MTKKQIRWIVWIIASPFLLFTLLGILIYLPPIQNVLVDKAASYASKATGITIQVGRISLSFPLNLVVTEVEAISDEADTLLHLKRMEVKVELLPLLKKRVEIEGISLQQALLNSGTLIPGMQIEGNIGELFIRSRGVDLGPEEALINQALLKDSDIKLSLTDSLPEDTTQSESLFWKLVLNQVDVENVSFAMQMPLDSLSLATTIRKAELKNGFIDLHESVYSLDKFHIRDAMFRMDQGELQLSEDELENRYFDPAHLNFSEIQVQVDSLFYKERDMRAVIRQLSMREASGLEWASTSGKLLSNSQVMRVTGLRAATPSSFVELDASFDWEVLSGRKEGWITAQLMGELAKPDLLLFMNGVDEEFLASYPDEPFRLRAGIDGTLQELKLTGVQVGIPTAFELTMQGELVHLVDSTQRGGAIKLEAQTENLDFIGKLAPGIAIPTGTRLSANFSVKGNQIMTDLILAQPRFSAYNQMDTLLVHAGNDSLSLKKDFTMSHAARLLAEYNLATTAYRAEVAINDFDLNQYLPTDSLYMLTFHMLANGVGYDLFSPTTTFQANALLEQFQYASYNLSGITLNASKEREKALMDLVVKNREIDLKAKLDATLNPQEVIAQLLVDVNGLDWDALRLSKTNLNTAHQLDVKLETNLKEKLSIDASLLNNRFITDKRTVVAKDLVAGFYTLSDSVTAFMKAGDLDLTFVGLGGLDAFLAQVNSWVAKTQEQLERKEINQEALKALYPTMDLKVSAGKMNPIYNVLSMNGVAYDNLSLAFRTSPETGVNGNFLMRGLHADSLVIDTISIRIQEELEAIQLRTSVVNRTKPNQEGFEMKLDGEVKANRIELVMQHLNARKEKGVYLGLAADLEKEGIRLNFFPEQPTIVYRPFNLNADNYFYLSNQGWIEGNVQMYDKQGCGVHMFTSKEDSTALHDFSLGLYKIDLKEFRRVMPYMPNIEGVLGVHAHYIATEATQTLSADVEVEQFIYEGSNLGDWELSAVYLPREDKGHSVDGYVRHNSNEIARWGGIYLPETEEKSGLYAGIKLNEFPLNVSNPFIPEQMAELSGTLNGTLTAKGNPMKPMLDGDLMFDSVAVYMPDYSANFRFDNRPIQVVNSKMLFNNFSIYTKGENPFTVDGAVDLTNLEQVNVDLRLNAENYELVNAPKTKRASVFGKVYVDFRATVRGPIEGLNIRGNMNLLGRTNVTYIMKDAPLTVNDRLDDLVEFVNFSDTITYESTTSRDVSIQGMDVSMTINIDQSAQAQVHLTPDGSNYVLLEGGGDLSFQYTPRGEMLLYGRYGLISGEMKYQIPIIPLKTFKVLNGSYVEWTGNPMNPTMNITATEAIRASVSEEGKASRMVSFNAGVQITQRLENPGLNFVLTAPEDATIQDKLNAVSAEERGKMAVTMLVTGMYIGEGSTSGSFSANNALNSFLQSEISNIAGKALDINLGMETVDNEEGGGKRTDYNFQFARRFWNNRFRIVIGGTVSTGKTSSQGESFIDNVAIEYRLDPSGMRNVKLFHEKNYESILEGEIIETGVGLVLHRKMSRLDELFIFKRKK
ncbi:MAG: translocation/assembly module TamB domain-containing protein [Phocaeicola sp.]